MAKNFRGFVEKCDSTIGLCGWFLDRNEPDLSVQVDIFVDNNFLCQAPADVFRQDLLNAGLGNGKHGFRIAVPDKFFDDKEHVFSLGADGIVIPSSAKVFLLPHKTFVPIILGNVDNCDDKGIRGWIVYENDLQQVVSIDVVIDDELIVTTEANLFRKDLTNFRDGNCAFNVDIPDKFLDGVEHKVGVYEAATKRILVGIKTFSIGSKLSPQPEQQHSPLSITVPATSTPKIAVVVHVYYLEIWAEIAQFLKAITHPFDLFVTTTTEQAGTVAPAVISDFPKARLHIQPNNGMDVLPFLALIPLFVTAGYLAVCKLHTKRGDGGEEGTSWRRALLHPLIGDDATFTAVVQAFVQYADLQLVGPASLYLSARKLMLNNEANVKFLYEQLENRPLPVEDWGFFAGSMLWLRPPSLQKLAQVVAYLQTQSSEYQPDGQISHAIDRLLGLVPVLNQGQVGLLHAAVGSSAKRYVLQVVAANMQINQAEIADVLRQYANLEQDVARLRDSGQLDMEHYLEQYPELVGLDVDLLVHYLLVGRIGEVVLKYIQPNDLTGKTILFVDYALPMYDRYAGSRTNYMYLLLCLKMGMKVIYLPYDFKHVEPYSTELKNLGVEILAGEWFLNNWKDWFKENGGEIDYAFLHKPNPAIHFLESILNHTNAIIVYQCHDLHYLRLQRQAKFTKDPILLDEANFFQEKENYLFSICDALLTFSSVEKEIIKKGFPHKQVHTVPLFFYEEKPKPKYDFLKRRDLLYVGGFEHVPNRDAVLWFCQQVLPLVLRRVPDIVFNVVGANPPKEITALNSANVIIHGKVSEAGLDALYDGVKLSLVPLQVGAGVKGKVIEALYHAVPLVSTSIGLEGITGIEQVATPKDDPVAFADEILMLYQHKELWLKKSELCARFVANHFTTQKTAEQIREIFAAAKLAAEERRDPTTESFEQNPLRIIAVHLPQYHPIPENNKWWGQGFTEWRNVCKAKPLFAGHYQPHIPTELGFYDLRLEEARIAQADLAREYGIHGFCYYHYWFNGKRLLERPVEEILASRKPDFPFCLCWANENWTRRWDGEDSEVLMEQVYSEADDRAHIQHLFRFFTDRRYIRVKGKPLFLVYRTENMPDSARTAKVWREEARKAGIGELYLVRVENMRRINPYEIGFDAALEFAPDWDRMGSMVSSYARDDTEVSEIVELPSAVYENNYTRSYVALMEQMLEKEQPPYTWFRCVTPGWDNSARRNEKAVILLGSSPVIYQQWLEKVIKSTIASNRPNERLVFVNAWNEWAEGNHLEPCIKWGRSYLEATNSGIKNSRLTMVPTVSVQPYHIPNFFARLAPEIGDHELVASLVKLMNEKKSSESIIISFEDFKDSDDDLTYLKGWAAINDEISTEGTDLMILVQKIDDKPRLIIPSKRKRPEITAHFGNKCNYDFSGFEAMVKRIDQNAKITVLIKRNGEMFWQNYR